MPDLQAGIELSEAGLISDQTELISDQTELILLTEPWLRTVTLQGEPGK